MNTDNAYPPDPEIMMTPEDIAELKRIDAQIRLEHAAAKLARPIKWPKEDE